MHLLLKNICPDTKPTVLYNSQHHVALQAHQALTKCVKLCHDNDSTTSSCHPQIR